MLDRRWDAYLRLFLLITFFLAIFSRINKENHLYILATPFSESVIKTDFYCYSPQKKKQAAMESLSRESQKITRFKGLGEISPDGVPAFYWRRQFVWNL